MNKRRTDKGPYIPLEIPKPKPIFTLIPGGKK